MTTSFVCPMKCILEYNALLAKKNRGGGYTTASVPKLRECVKINSRSWFDVIFLRHIARGKWYIEYRGACYVSYLIFSLSYLKVLSELTEYITTVVCRKRRMKIHGEFSQLNWRDSVHLSRGKDCISVAATSVFSPSKDAFFHYGQSYCGFSNVEQKRKYRSGK